MLLIFWIPLQIFQSTILIGTYFYNIPNCIRILHQALLLNTISVTESVKMIQKMLADIGIAYGSLADNWKESYNAIKAYLDEHGELPLKEASITLPTGSQSHWWIRNQTLMLHQGRQSEDKVKLLSEIGIV